MIALEMARRSSAVVERNLLAHRRVWPIFLAGFLEPFLYLASIGIGVGALVGDLTGPGGELVPYRAFVAPALFATAAMNGAVFDTTISFFLKFKYGKTFDAMLATPLSVHDVALGEALSALVRGTVYSAAFVVAMWGFGLISSLWGLALVPVAMLISFAFAGAGLASSTWMRSFIDFDYVTLALVPLFLFSATFFPLDQYPAALGWVIRLTPLYQGVALARSLALGVVGPGLLLHVAYLAAMGLGGVSVARRRLALLLQP